MGILYEKSLLIVIFSILATIPNDILYSNTGYIDNMWYVDRIVYVDNINMSTILYI